MQNHPIIEKVKKLLALANNAAASEGERDNSLRMAHGLLAKHNLDMAMVKASEQCEGREEHVNATYGMVWCRNVSHSVAKLFFCNYFYGKKINCTKMNHHFVGKSSNVTPAALMADYVIHSILKEARSRGWHNLSPEARSFAMGATRTIQERVKEMMADPKTEGGQSTDLVVINLYTSEREANEAFLSDKYRLITKAQRQAYVKGAAYDAGKSFGSTVGLNVQVSRPDTLRIGK